MTGFTTDQLGWTPWLTPLTEPELTDAHREALVDASRAASPYFRLLAHDPEILHARTKTDNDIFYNAKSGLPRPERELAATATSRRNGCVFCASVHARFAAHYSKRPDDVRRLLDEGVAAPQDGRWRAIIDASVALAATPVEFGAEHIEALRAAGLDDLAISDTIHAAAFFNWANRLMLSLGEPTDDRKA
ncbi:alkylhydroperoxidase domain protein [Nonomuraea sp. NPDC026600]|uniref:alkylhydroperoxidase domain protein n=1 Tax=Nonomuraea sp. NPDC026600 TaxID=3155363 RepID=UPI0033E35713